MISRYIALFILLLAFADRGKGQSEYTLEPKPYNPTKMTVVIGGGTAFYAGTLVGLSTLWYSDKNRTDFHFFDDNSGWMQVDKFGHMYTAYIMGKAGYRSLLWAGADRKKAIWYGGSYGFVFLTSVEILDGHYKEWGASVGDMVANGLGSALFIGQELTVGHQAVTMKFSYNPSPLAQYRPEVLGSNDLERVIKDYNGQTYWYSANYRSFFRSHNFFPKWLNIAGGYAAYGMLGGDENPAFEGGQRLPEVERYRKYLLSLDVDFEKIPTNSSVLRSVFFFLDLIKIPFPTLEYNSKGEFIFHPVYF